MDLLVRGGGRRCPHDSEGKSRVRRLIAAVGVVAFLAVGAAPRQPYVKSITCDLLRGKYTNCQVTLLGQAPGPVRNLPRVGQADRVLLRQEVNGLRPPRVAPTAGEVPVLLGAVRRRHPRSRRRRRIGEFWSYQSSRASAELLIDCEEDRTLRAVLVGMLRDPTHATRPVG